MAEPEPRWTSRAGRCAPAVRARGSEAVPDTGARRGRPGSPPRTTTRRRGRVRRSRAAAWPLATNAPGAVDAGHDGGHRRRVTPAHAHEAGDGQHVAVARRAASTAARAPAAGAAAAAGAVGVIRGWPSRATTSDRDASRKRPAADERPSLRPMHRRLVANIGVPRPSWHSRRGFAETAPLRNGSCPSIAAASAATRAAERRGRLALPLPRQQREAERRRDAPRRPAA